MLRQLLMIAGTLLIGWVVHMRLSVFYMRDVQGGTVVARTVQQYQPLRAEVDTLIVGDSHPKWGILAAQLDNAFNLAIPGQTMPETYAVLKAQIDDPVVNPRRVVLSADATVFSNWQSYIWIYNHYYSRYEDMWELGRLRGQPLLYLVRGITGRHAPYMGQRFTILKYLDSGLPPDLPFAVHLKMARGSFESQTSEADRPRGERRGVIEERLRMQFPHHEFDEVAALYFSRVLELCRKKGIGVLVVRYPLTAAYLRGVDEIAAEMGLEGRLAELLAPHPEVRLLDARAEFVGNLSLFADVDHLNVRGARRFTPRIRAELEALAH